MIRFNVIAFTHNSIGLDEIGKFHVETDAIVDRMNKIKQEMNLSEIMYLSTCNRVEFIFVAEEEVDGDFMAIFLKAFNSDWDHARIQMYLERAKCWNGINAVNHLIEVASSVDSMVIGEREIITQVRNAYEFSKANNLSGDLIRVVIRQTIETAKKVYTETTIANKPVSVVSLAYHSLNEKQLELNARVVVVGAGVTNTNMCRFLKKHGFRNYTIYNRSLEKAEVLARFTGGVAKPLSELKNHSDGFDILVSCTGSQDHIITSDIYKILVGKDSGKKVVIDLAIPSDLDPQLVKKYPIDHISVEYLKTIADSNLKERKKELIKVRQIIYEKVEEFKEIFKMRQVELKMRSIPERVKEIRSTAVNQVFSKELSQLDSGSKEVLEKILDYMEKKYVSVPMLMAKEMLMTKDSEK
ncbi:MAG: glutamyl-tRNA reductase [Crocinitomicaceae bacterium]|jgi:glutamyl-tRNA reductase|nr:glutamyl-tRNA reductase [Crocinitomicaceae bacterium]MBK9590268.1 glutamyl-tRNA reductase [Crocinitomicaceae bacterium]